MAYFDEFPLLVYRTLKRDPKIAKDILRRVAIRKNLQDETRMFIEYNVKDTDTPEIIADRLYDDASLHWIVLFMNNMFNRWIDWPMPQDRLRAFVLKKYGENNVDDVHHYELIDGTWTNGQLFIEDSDDFNLQDSSGEFISFQDITTNIGQPLPVSNFQYEDALNEEKRQIRLLRSELVGAVIDEFRTKIKA